MRLGNDIVDRAYAGQQHPRFAQRILNTQERLDYESMPRDTEGYDRIWIYWAAKEAAWKAIQQQRKTLFSPRTFAVDLEQEQVSFEGETLALRLHVDGDLVFAEVSDSPWSRVHWRYTQFFSEPTASDQSQEARRLALSLGVEILGCEEADLSVSKVDKIPYLQAEKGQRSWPLSLTHHGRYVAASLTY